MNYHKTIFSSVSNIIFIVFSIFILSFIWINFYLRDWTKSLIIAILLCATFSIIFFPIKNIINKKHLQKNNSIKTTEYLKTQILLGNNESTISTIRRAYDLLNITPTTSQNHYLDLENKKDIFFMFDSESLQDSDIIYIMKNSKYNSIEIFCLDNIRIPIIKNTEIRIQKLQNIKEKLNEKNLKIDYKINLLKRPIYSRKEILCTILSKDKSRNYFGFGLLLIFSSLFTIYSTYYIIVGTIMILLSIYCRFNKKFN